MYYRSSKTSNKKNTASTYFNRFKKVLKEVYKKKLITSEQL
ncbi:phage integrase SAM-like domain-containing protein [Chryseobacterium joostei]